MTHVVVDASIAVKWLVEEVHSREAGALITIWAAAGLTPVAPYFMPAEVANALHRRVRSEELSLAAATGLVELLMASGVELRETRRIHTRALELASALEQSAAYDSHYLALAEELDCELWTADARFHRAAARSTDRVRLLGESRAGLDSGPELRAPAARGRLGPIGSRGGLKAAWLRLGNHPARKRARARTRIRGGC